MSHHEQPGPTLQADPVDRTQNALFEFPPAEYTRLLSLWTEATSGIISVP